MTALTRKDRLRRTTLLCCSFARNLAYYRVGFEDCGKPFQFEGHPHSSFWRQVNSNFLDLCVLEWCKLFGDKKGEHYWDQIISNREGFETALLKHLGGRSAELPGVIEEMRRYRDKFVAHLDTDLVMQIPMLDIAQRAVWFYHGYLVRYEATVGDLAGLADRPDSMTLGYNQCVEEARAIMMHAACFP